jgi:hypothetical protein
MTESEVSAMVSALTYVRAYPNTPPQTRNYTIFHLIANIAIFILLPLLLLLPYFIAIIAIIAIYCHY